MGALYYRLAPRDGFAWGGPMNGQGARCRMVVIDDFRVPDDEGYRFDDYGPGKALTWDYVGPIAERYGATAAYPATPSAEETGARRGCVVLARAGAWLDGGLLRGRASAGV